MSTHWIGCTLDGRWRIEAPLGRGAVGIVFAATDLALQRRVALKVMHANRAGDPELRRRFMAEAAATSRIDHPGIVRIYEVTEIERLPCLVMELIAGTSLEVCRLSAGGRLPVDRCREIGGEILSALAAAHDVQVIHRDINLSNVLLVAGGRVKIADFGFARVGPSVSTKMGMLLGTPGFMAPEQISGDPRAVDERADIWSVGAALFLLAAGLPPQPGSRAAEILVAALVSRPVPIRSVAPWVTEPLASVIDRALEPDRTKRWASAQDMRRALELREESPLLVVPRPSPRAITGAWTILAIIALLSSAALCGIAFANVRARVAGPAVPNAIRR